MCTVPQQTATKTPPEPEQVHYTEKEINAARKSAKTAAANRYGLAGTNVTGGVLLDENVESKKKTLGGM